MMRLFIGIGVAVVGVLLFICMIFYGWISVTPNVDAAHYASYQRLAAVFGISSLIVFVGGIVIVVRTIRKMNREYKKEELVHPAKGVGVIKK